MLKCAYTHSIMGVDTQPERMTSAVEAALAARPAADRLDAGAEQVALNYARLIDAAAPAARYARPLAALTRAVDAYDAPDAADALLAVTTALAEHSVASDLGPKLLAALVELGLTPKARAALSKGGRDDGPAQSPLDELRARRAARG